MFYKRHCRGLFQENRQENIAYIHFAFVLCCKDNSNW
jgi:hypothetical protein